MAGLFDFTHNTSYRIQGATWLKKMTPENMCLFSSLVVLEPRDGHTVQVLPPFISLLCHTDRLFHEESCPHTNVLSRPYVVFLTCVHLALFLALSLSSGNSLVSSWCDHSMLASLH